MVYKLRVVVLVLSKDLLLSIIVLLEYRGAKDAGTGVGVAVTVYQGVLESSFATIVRNTYNCAV